MKSMVHSVRMAACRVAWELDFGPRRHYPRLARIFTYVYSGLTRLQNLIPV